jgi:hypothetical protein
MLIIGLYSWCMGAYRIAFGWRYTPNYRWWWDRWLFGGLTCATIGFWILFVLFVG